MRTRNTATLSALACVAVGGLVATGAVRADDGAQDQGGSDAPAAAPVAAAPVATAPPVAPAEVGPAEAGPAAGSDGRRAFRQTKLNRTTSVKTKKKVFFVTIDDGNVKSRAALRFVEQQQMPVTVFLTNASVGHEWKYFRKIASYGGSVENHTMTHRSLPGLGSAALRDEICTPQKIYRKKFGVAPTLLRPPYGNGGYLGDSTAVKQRIDATAASCGIDRIVMWDVVVGSGKIEYVRAPLRRGDIVLLHFGPNLAEELKMVIKLGKRQGLHPASLTDFI